MSRVARWPSERDHAALIAMQCRAFMLPQPEFEYHFHPLRQFRADAAWPAHKVLLEVEGGAFLPKGSRHTRGAGFRKDCEKYAEAAILGWRVIRVMPEHVKSGQAIQWIQRALGVSDVSASAGRE